MEKSPVGFAQLLIISQIPWTSPWVENFWIDFTCVFFSGWGEEKIFFLILILARTELDTRHASTIATEWMDDASRIHPQHCHGDFLCSSLSRIIPTVKRRGKWNSPLLRSRVAFSLLVSHFSSRSLFFLCGEKMLKLLRQSFSSWPTVRVLMKFSYFTPTLWTLPTRHLKSFRRVVLRGGWTWENQQKFSQKNSSNCLLLEDSIIGQNKTKIFITFFDLSYSFSKWTAFIFYRSIRFLCLLFFVKSFFIFYFSLILWGIS